MTDLGRPWPPSSWSSTTSAWASILPSGKLLPLRHVVEPVSYVEVEPNGIDDSENTVAANLLTPEPKIRSCVFDTVYPAVR